MREQIARVLGEHCYVGPMTAYNASIEVLDLIKANAGVMDVIGMYDEKTLVSLVMLLTGESVNPKTVLTLVRNWKLRAE